MSVRVALIIVVLALAGCSGSDGSVDAGPVDAGLRDAGVSDAGVSDAGPVDAGPVDAGPVDAGCNPGSDGGYLSGPFTKLSAYCLVAQRDDAITFSPGVVPYDINTPLFSDYAVKVRGVWVPPGTQAVYVAGDGGATPFDFPLGTILIKSFGFRDDFRKAQPVINWVETRLLVNTDAGWKGYPYIWDDGGDDATLSYSGEVTPLSWIDADGGTVDANYLVPSAAQCKQCHSVRATALPIGPKARNLNKDFDYPTGPENQLTHWSRVGILTGAPADPSTAPRLPVWNDPSTGSVEARARAYLEVNCAHCHNAEGYGRTSGLFLWADQSPPSTYGICKAPVAAGPATGGNAYDVVPGDPDHSILIYRVTSTEPGVAMPLIGRSVVDREGLALLREWVSGLDGGCP